MIFAERIPAFQQLLPHDAQRMLNIDPRQVVVAFAQAVVGGVDLPPEEMPPSLYFPVNNRKKTGRRAQPSAGVFPASYGMKTGNGARHSACGPPGARQITGRNRTKTGNGRNLSLQHWCSRGLTSNNQSG
jgi:hypothetical protein